MMSKAELEVLAEKYEAKASRAFMNYQETGITRYDRERINAEELADAMRMAASASDNYARLVHLRADVSVMASDAKAAMRAPEEEREEAMEKVLKSLVSVAVMGGLISDDGF